MTESQPWWRSAVVYQVYPRSFADSDGDGIGDLRGLIGRLDHLERLGVDVLWLSPVYPSPQDDNGYDISDYRDVDPVFGTLADLDELIEAVHARGMRLMLDVVVNHTSDEHPWFADSRASRESVKRDWYWWRPPRPGHVGGEPGAEPTDWHGFFSGPVWEWDEASGEYYLHLFSAKQPDLNWENPQVRAAVQEMLRWWADRGVDGFRLDVINLISKAVRPDGTLPDGVDSPALAGTGLADGSAHYTNGPRLEEFLGELHREVFAAPTARGDVLVTVGEMPGVTLPLARSITDPGTPQLDMVFTFEHVSLDHGPGGKWDPRPLTLPALKANLAAWQTGLGDGWNALYWNNHDQPRIVSRWGDDSPEHRVASAKTLGTVLHLMRGTPFVYQGEELGLTNVSWTGIEDYRDLETLNHYRQAVRAGADPADVLAAVSAMGRDNARTPMPWSDAPHGGFTAGTPWLPANPAYPELNAAVAWADPRSVLHHYRRLIELRHTQPVVVDGDFELLLPDHEQLMVYRRTLGTQVLTVVANMSSAPASLDRTDLGITNGQVLLATHPPAPDDAGDVLLRPWESRVVLSTSALTP
ncbi:glycoside hydrolase family 13 protein [Occultella kanbiaonis]|uniref:glycoside hydrolase family 13 protein n=1 Tax=Occultella kanbiaonis TaxID=2675754 RepID=UPI0013D589A6|nr:alpha-glucosidase [Occultella kanbiaonis]